MNTRHLKTLTRHGSTSRQDRTQKGQDSKEQENAVGLGQDTTGQVRTRQDKTRQDRAGNDKDKTGQGTKQDKTGQDST